MEKTYLQEIVNKTVSSIVTEEESICITFEDGLQLTVFNNYAVEKAAELSDFIGAHTIEVDESPVNVAITFQNGAGLNISLEDEDWNGPEAIELILSDGQIVVWN